MSTITSLLSRVEGTSLVFKTNPAIGLIALTGFVDDETVVPGSSFIKIFRYSKNGVIFSEWQALTIQNIVAITLTEKNVFVAEINYQKVPADSTIDVTTFTISATDGTAALAGDYFKNSLFNRYFSINDVEALNWHINVLEKIYQKGLIPNYIERLDDFNSPEDFLALWGAVSRFFSFYVKLARVYAKFYNNDKLIREFLTQRGLIVSPENTLFELQEMLETYYFQMSKRGTLGVMNDELLRLIHYKNNIDEYIWCLYRKHHFGWNLGNSSPLYRGLRINDGLNKIPWSLRYVGLQDAADYTNGTISMDGDKEVISFTTGGVVTFTGASAIVVDPRLDYQISFKIKLTSGTFSLAGIGYNSVGGVVNLKSKKTTSDENSFFTTAVLSRSDRYLTIRCSLYNKDSGVSALNQNNIRQGQNLRAISTLAKLGLTLTLTGVAKVYDFRIVPTLTSYSRGFLQTNNFISLWLLNRNGQYHSLELKNYISKYLIPYNCHIKISEINEYELGVTDTANETFYWVPSGEYCRMVKWIPDGDSCELTDLEWIPDEDTAYCEQETE